MVRLKYYLVIMLYNVMLRTEFCLSLLIIIVVFIPHSGRLLSTANAQSCNTLNPAIIEAMIKSNGAKRVVECLSADQKKWKQVLRNIAIGERPWLSVAVHLKPGSDAGTSEMLNFAIGEALETFPESVLEIAIGQYSLGDVCNGPDVDDVRYSTFEKAVGAVRRRIEALEMIENVRVEGSRNRCVQSLKESIVHLKHFYGEEKAGPVHDSK